jgi:hypothetical protein
MATDEKKTREDAGDGHELADDSTKNGFKPTGWGQLNWTIYHTWSYVFNDPAVLHPLLVEFFYTAIRDILPCVHCRNSYRCHLTNDAILTLKWYILHRKLPEFVYLVHNAVNCKLKKRIPRFRESQKWFQQFLTCPNDKGHFVERRHGEEEQAGGAAGDDFYHYADDKEPFPFPPHFRGILRSNPAGMFDGANDNEALFSNAAMEDDDDDDDDNVGDTFDYFDGADDESEAQNENGQDDENYDYDNREGEEREPQTRESIADDRHERGACGRTKQAGPVIPSSIEYGADSCEVWLFPWIELFAANFPADIPNIRACKPADYQCDLRHRLKTYVLFFDSLKTFLSAAQCSFASTWAAVYLRHPPTLLTFSCRLKFLEWLLEIEKRCGYRAESATLVDLLKWLLPLRSSQNS